MILRNIELDLKYQKNNQYIEELLREQNITYNEAVRLDYENNWKDKRHVFKKLTRCMTSMLEQYMGRIETKDCWKIIFVCENNPGDMKITNLLGAYEIPFKFDYQFFISSSDEEKKKIIINEVYKWIQQEKNDFSFDLTGIENACKIVVEKDYHNEFVWKNKIKKGDFQVSLKICHDIECVKLVAVFSKKQEVIYEKLVVETEPHELAYNRYLGTMEWVNNNTIAIITNDGEKILIECNEI